MKPAVRILFLCMFVLAALCVPRSYADGPAAGKAGRNKAGAAAKSEKAEKTASASSTSARPAATPQGPMGAGAAPAEAPEWTPMPATTGGLGLFTVETGETLPRKGFAFSTYVDKFGRMPGHVTVLNVGFNVSVGITDRISLFVRFEPHRYIHVGDPGQLSFNAPLGNPGFGTTIYRSLIPVVGAPPGYVEDYPFANRNSGGVGEVFLGGTLGLASQLRGHWLNLATRHAVVFPTSTGLLDLVNNQVQSGQVNYVGQVSASRTWFGDFAVTALEVGYRATRDPRSGNQRAMNQADQLRVGAGFLLFPARRLQVISEYTGVVFLGDATTNTTFGARDPIDGTWGIRFYPVRNVAFDLGYRYMLNLVRHGDRHGFVAKLGTVYWPEEKKVNRAPSAACAAEKSSVYAGSDEMVRVTVTASDPDGDALNYNWTASGGRVEGSGTEVRWNSGGTAAGSYTVTARVDDGKGGMASCSVEIRVEPRPNRAPSLTCSADRTSVLVGERVRITATASDPDGDALSYAWRTNGGQIVGGGAAVQLDTTGVAAGRYTVTGRVDDGRGGANDCAVNVAVNAPPPAPEASKLNECFFRASSARVDNVCKRILDDVALRLQSDPRARVVLVGYADPREPRPERLAAARANAAKTYLGEKGIAAARVDVRTAGGQVGAGRQNRRLDVIWVPEGATY
jgi:outer membrane protein OmpA-like peptidoglycan-associated protein